MRNLFEIIFLLFNLNIMESWSSQIDKFKIKVFLDTNVLCYLVDNTYPALTQLISELGKMPIVDLISSEFVLTEFIGVRKQEHYFREALKRAEIEKIKIDFSSLLKYNKRYEIPHLGFDVLKTEIYNAVKADEKAITVEHNIEFCCGFNRSLLKPTSDICLSSRISKEDSLVLVSAVYMDIDRAIDNMILVLTNDNDFHTWFKEANAEINNIFTRCSVNTPRIENLRKFGDSNMLGLRTVNFSDQKGEDINVKEYITEYMQKLILQEYHNIYIGKIFKSKTDLPKQCICFKAKVGTEIINYPYIMVVDKNLNFIYCPDHRIDFWYSNESIGEKYMPTTDNNNISFKIQSELDADIFAKINAEENLIFIHPDN